MACICCYREELKDLFMVDEGRGKKACMLSRV